MSHVGIYIGNGKIVDAANPSTGVQRDRGCSRCRSVERSDPAESSETTTSASARFDGWPSLARRRATPAAGGGCSSTAPSERRFPRTPRPRSRPRPDPATAAQVCWSRTLETGVERRLTRPPRVRWPRGNQQPTRAHWLWHATSSDLDLGRAVAALRRPRRRCLPASAAPLRVCAEVRGRRPAHLARGGDAEHASTLEIPMLLDAWDGASRAFRAPCAMQRAAGSRCGCSSGSRCAGPTSTLLVTTQARRRRRSPRQVERGMAHGASDPAGMARRPGASRLPGRRTSSRRRRGWTPQRRPAIAAITTTTDGSSGADSAVQVYLNPPVFDPLGAAGATDRAQSRGHPRRGRCPRGRRAALALGGLRRLRGACRHRPAARPCWLHRS